VSRIEAVYACRLRSTLFCESKMRQLISGLVGQLKKGDLKIQIALSSQQF
jgi:hypothetical protein